MKPLLKIVGCLVITLLGLALFTETVGGRALTEVWGWPVVAVAQGHAHGWIALGQFDARGVLVLAQNGFGLVALTQAGVGVVFGIGQAIAGLVCIGQVGIGLFFWLGQGGLGLQALMGWKPRGLDWFKELNAEFSELLSFRASPRA